MVGRLLNYLTIWRPGFVPASKDTYPLSERDPKLYPMPISKLLDIEEAAKIASWWRSFGAKVVLACGCFDLLHPGHVRLLRYACEHGRILFVGINSDKSVQLIKGMYAPIVSQWARAEMLAGLEVVKHIVIFDAPTPWVLLDALQPDVYVKGADYEKQELPELQDLTRPPKVVFAPYHPAFSTSAVRSHIAGLGWPGPYRAWPRSQE